MPDASAVLLNVEGLGKAFRSLQALQGYHLILQPGEFVGIIGPNGAGKTTLFNLLTGVSAPSMGRIRFANADITGYRADQIARRGIARTFQKIRLFQPLTALENLRVALQSHEPVWFWEPLLMLPRYRRAERAVTEEGLALLERVGLADVAHTRTAQLSYSQQRRLELASALALRPRLLLLDEPAAGMNPTEADTLIDLILRLHQELALTTVLIEHNMRIVMNTCRRIQVLNYGQIIAEGEPHAIRNDPRVVEAYLGHAVEH